MLSIATLLLFAGVGQTDACTCPVPLLTFTYAGLCEAEWECRLDTYDGQGATMGYTAQDERGIASRACDNCLNCQPVDCTMTLEVEERRTGIVSRQVDTAIQGGVNIALANAIQLEVTAQFAAGQTLESTIIHRRSIVLGGPVARCSFGRFVLKESFVVGVAQTPVIGRWFFRLNGVDLAPWDSISCPADPAGTFPWLGANCDQQPVMVGINGRIFQQWLTVFDNGGHGCTQYAPCCVLTQPQLGLPPNPESIDDPVPPNPPPVLEDPNSPPLPSGQP